jgi:polyisoprenoid-binding protein YceI
LTFNGIVATRMGPTAGFSGELTIKLSDFGVPFTPRIRPGRRVVGDDLKIELQIEARPQAA